MFPGMRVRASNRIRKWFRQPRLLRLEDRVTPATLSAAIVGNDLVITDTAGVNNFLLVALNGSNYDITDGAEQFQTAPSPPGILSNGDKTLSVSTATFSGKIILNTMGGDDFLTVYSLVNITRNIDYNGGAGTNDKMGMKGGSFASVTHTPVNANDGSIYYVPTGIDPPWTLTYTGLEPVDMSGSTINDLVLNLPAAASDAYLEDSGFGGDGKSQLRSNNVTFETTIFSSPVNSLKINRGNASDSITVSALPDFNRTLTIGASTAPFGPMTFGGAVTFAANYSLSAFSSSMVNFSTATSDLTMSGTGSASINTTRNINMTSGSSIASVDGAISLTANSASSTAGNFVGIKLDGATISTSGTGGITMLAYGGFDTSTSGHHGIYLANGAALNATSTGIINIAGYAGGASFGSWGLGITSGSMITAAGGTIQVGGYSVASVAAGSSGNIGTRIEGLNSKIAGSGTSTVIIDGQGGFGSAGNNAGIHIATSSLASAISAANGTIILNGFAGVGNSLNGNPSQGIYVELGKVYTTGLGNIFATADIIDIAPTTGALDAGSNGIVIKQYTNNRPVNLGSETVGSLALTDAELDQCTAGTLFIGNTVTGTITVSAAITHGNNLSLTTGAGDYGESINHDGGDQASHRLGGRHDQSCHGERGL